MSKITKVDIPVSDIVQTVSFSPFEWSNDLFAYGTCHHLIVERFKVNPANEGESKDFSIDCERVRDFHHGTRVTVLAWSPTTNLLAVPQVLTLATVGSNYKVNILSSNLKEDEIVKSLEGHTAFVNDVAYEPVDGEIIASCSDDLTCRLWKADDGTQTAIFPLAAPGMRVQWHTMDPMKIMVADKVGTIRFYSTISNQPIMSLESNLYPTLTADWCSRNSLLVSVLAGTDWILFDTSRPSRAVEGKYIYADGGSLIRWSKSHDNIIATLGFPKAHLKILNTRTKQEISHHIYPIAGSMSWHHHLPLLVVGGDKKLHFWHIDKI